jgi:hypothetical protein
MSPLTDKAWNLFMDATLREENLGYPDDVAFVPGDEEWSDEAVWRTLAEEGRPVVLVGEETELLLVPYPRTVRDRLAGHVRVLVKQHVDGHDSQYATASTLGRHPVRQMRQLAHA